LSTCEFDNFQVGNWETQAMLGVVAPLKPTVIGKAYAQDRDTGDPLGPAHWKIERMVTHEYDGPGVKNEWFPNESHTPPLLVSPFATDSIDRGNYSYPPETGWSGNKDHFSVRYTAEFYADHDGDYAFEEHVDDEAWLVIDGTEELHNTQWNVDTSVVVPLTTGWHTLEFRTREGGGGDYARLRWDPAGGTDWEVMDILNAQFRTSFDYTVAELLAEGVYNVGDPFTMGDFGFFLDQPEEYVLRLTVDYQGETTVVEDTFMGLPEPATCLVLGAGALTLAVRRRRRQS
jgi:hypothetical protein